jgi:hypothetical protein
VCAVAALNFGAQPGGVVSILLLLHQQVGEQAAGQPRAGLFMKLAHLGRPTRHGGPVLPELRNGCEVVVVVVQFG